jgi:SAM-dependent methyltransferase
MLEYMACGRREGVLVADLKKTLQEMPIVGTLARYGYWWATLPAKVNRILEHIQTMLFELKQLKQLLTQELTQVQQTLPNIETKVDNSVSALESLEDKINTLSGQTLEQTTVDKILRQLGELTINKQPNLTYFNQKFSDYEILRWNVKCLGYEFARQQLAQHSVEIKDAIKVGLTSKLCVQKDIESDWFFYWCSKLNCAPLYHRKLWEFCYILQVLHDHSLMKPGLNGVGFGCGEEPLPSLLASYDIHITITDLTFEQAEKKGWVTSSQHASSLQKIKREYLCSSNLLDKNLSLEYVNMNDIPERLFGQFDFCWSACALEHLGSLENGLEFIENSLNVLKPGGIAVHTTEFNLTGTPTIDDWPTVLFTEDDMNKLAENLMAKGHIIPPFDFNKGSGPIDHFVDVPPFPWQSTFMINTLPSPCHLKLSIHGIPCTSIGIIVQKAN